MLKGRVQDIRGKMKKSMEAVANVTLPPSGPDGPTPPCSTASMVDYYGTPHPPSSRSRPWPLPDPRTLVITPLGRLCPEGH